jgi:hypothetical protein
LIETEVLVMSSMRIVLVDPLGDVLFSGESWLASGSEGPAANHDGDEIEAAFETAPPAHEDDLSECPRTLRSGGSGIFPVGHGKRDERAA